MLVSANVLGAVKREGAAQGEQVNCAAVIHGAAAEGHVAGDGHRAGDVQHVVSHVERSIDIGVRRGQAAGGERAAGEVVAAAVSGDVQQGVGIDGEVAAAQGRDSLAEEQSGGGVDRSAAAIGVGRHQGQGTCAADRQAQGAAAIGEDPVVDRRAAGGPRSAESQIGQRGRRARHVVGHLAGDRVERTLQAVDGNTVAGQIERSGGGVAAIEFDIAQDGRAAKGPGGNGPAIAHLERAADDVGVLAILVRETRRRVEDHGARTADVDAVQDRAVVVRHAGVHVQGRTCARDKVRLVGLGAPVAPPTLRNKI